MLVKAVLFTIPVPKLSQTPMFTKSMLTTALAPCFVLRSGVILP